MSDPVTAIEPPLPEQVVAFWREAGPRAWFSAKPEFDAAIRGGFEPLHHAAARGELGTWGEAAQGSLALLLLLDQFPRNLYRGSAHAFATDPLARRIAGAALAAGHDAQVDYALRPFFYLPFEHSEAMADQDRAVTLFEAHGDADTLKYARVHRDVIARFGRFPHRNTALGRETTPEETAFLASGGFRG